MPTVSVTLILSMGCVYTTLHLRHKKNYALAGYVSNTILFEAILKQFVSQDEEHKQLIDEDLTASSTHI